MSQNVSPAPVFRWPAVAGGALLLLLLLALAPSAAQAQIQLELRLNRRSYIIYEPIIATVTITNLAGRDVTFEDAGPKPWFNVEVYAANGRLLSPYDSDYKLQPLTVRAGESVKRQIDLTPLFPINEIGPNRVRANVYLADVDKYFGSNMFGFDLTDGKVIWRQDVGVPGGGMRQLSLLTHRLPDKLLLFVRVRDEEHNVVYATQSLNRVLTSGRDPQVLLDRSNTMHILHQAAPKTFLYTVMSLDGERLDQKVYTEATGKHMVMLKNANGGIDVRGGELQTSPVGADGSLVSGIPAGPKLSDRPMGLAVPRIPTKAKGDAIPQ